MRGARLCLALALLTALFGCTRSQRRAAPAPERHVAPLPTVTAVNHAAPPGDAASPALCLPAASCGCFRASCLSVVPIAPPRALTPEGRSVIVSHSCPGEPGNHVTRCLDWVETAETCTGACMLEDPSYRCGVVQGECRKL